MKAEEARKLTESYYNSPRIMDLMTVIYNRIKDAAERGLDCVNLWIPGSQTEKEIDIVKRRLVQDGYRLTEHKASDTRDIREMDYTNIHW